MPYKYEFPDLSTGSCVSYYKVEYKRATDTNWNVISPMKADNPIVVEPLDDCTTYNIRITKFCCNGQQSDPVTVNVTTPGDCHTT